MSPINDVLDSAQAQPRPVALFISDLHLQESRPKTNAAFCKFLKEYAIHSESLYLLGDIFEYWAGDDDLGNSFNKRIAEAIHGLAQSGVAVYWIDGNRDFLAGAELLNQFGATRLQDPHIAQIAGRKFLLSHGDAYCTDDVEYMKFRTQVRNKSWQEQFLALPLAQRKTIIEGARKNSREEQQSKSAMIMDVNQAAIREVVEQSATFLMIHGHTHRPALHHELTSLGQRFSRYVLPDWEMDHEPYRGGWLAILENGRIERRYFSENGNIDTAIAEY